MTNNPVRPLSSLMIQFSDLRKYLNGIAVLNVLCKYVNALNCCIN